MMIAPIIFTTVVVGLAGLGNLKRLGRIGLKSLVYFEVMTTLALIIGLVVAKVLKPGAGMNVDVASLDTKDIERTLAAAQQHHSFADYLLNIIPDTFVGAFAKGDILQALFISVLFGIAMASLGEANRPVILALEQTARALMRMIAMIIKVAPFAVCAAMSFTISKWGLDSLKHQAKIMLCVYGTCVTFVLVCLGLLLRYNGINVFKFLRYVREELFIVFGTASSRAAPDDDEARKPRLREATRRPRAARGLHLQPRRHVGLPDDGRAFHRAGNEHAPHLRPGARRADRLPAHLERGRHSRRQRVHHARRHARLDEDDSRRRHGARARRRLADGPGPRDDQHDRQWRRHDRDREMGKRV
jgi:hypothetical protein